MAKRYTFRKVYFVCEDKKVYRPNARTQPSFQFIEDAEQIRSNREGELWSYIRNNPAWVPPKFTVEGFYLVHESLFEKFLEQFQNDNIKLLK